MHCVASDVSGTWDTSSSTCGPAVASQYSISQCGPAILVVPSDPSLGSNTGTVTASGTVSVGSLKGSEVTCTGPLSGQSLSLGCLSDGISVCNLVLTHEA